MQICAITMVYRDHWALSQWYRHFGAQLGHGNLFIVAHGADPRIAKLCPKANIVTIPRGDLSDFDAQRGRMLNHLQNALSEVYDWVIRTDADELICLDPARFASFEDLLSNRQGDAVFALGLNVIEKAVDEDLSAQDNVFALRDRAIFSGHYSKAWAVRGGISLDHHGVRVNPSKVQAFNYDLPVGVYMAHLKFANTAALANANTHRKQIAQGKGTNLPGTAWRKPKTNAKHMFKNAELFVLHIS